MVYSPAITSDEIAQESALLSLTEIGWGSLIHGFHIPFGGHLLSLNQGFLLAHFVSSRSEKKGIRAAPFIVSQYAALLKSLSPMGKKLTPMLAISMQGSLFSSGVWVFGTNLFGITIGSCLLAIWGFVQPIALYLLFFGMNLVDALKKLANVLHLPIESLAWILLGVVLSKLFISIGLGFLAVHHKDRTLLAYRNRLQRYAPKLKAPKRTFFSKILHEIFRPSFLVCFILTATFLYFAESDRTKAVLGVLRPIAISFALYWLFQWLPLEKWFKLNSDSVLTKLRKEVS